jgi:ApaG protein
MVSEVTEGIRISVESSFVPQQSAPERRQYVFSYSITIRNESPRRVQLLRRRWAITDGDNRVTEVYGDGVVGEQPVLDPGDEYTYTSGAVLETPAGTMQGSYEFEDPDGRLQQVAIPLFILGQPQTLH